MKPNISADLRLVLAGAPVNNDNRGVEALGRSVAEHLPSSQSVRRLSILDGGWGIRESRTGIEMVGVRNSRRWYRRESWTRVRIDQVFGGLGSPIAQRLSNADAVLDLSGGDSFTDLYGPARLNTVCAPKDAALRARVPLVFLPQTFGPFETVAGRRRAERLVRSASLAYARDAWSYERLLELAGHDANASLLRQGVDVAFGLRERQPADSTADRLADLAGEVVAGVNLSGLLKDAAASRRFGLAGDYIQTSTAIVKALISQGSFVVFVPHVHGERDGENDETVISMVTSRLTPAERARTWMISGHLRAAELKWCVARMDWFTGSRMHATIAALSSGVPAFGYAYSDKARGVFGTCGTADQVADARTVAGAEAVELAVASFTARDEVRRVLRARVPTVVGRATEQLDEVLAAVAAWRGTGTAEVVA